MTDLQGVGTMGVLLRLVGLDVYRLFSGYFPVPSIFPEGHLCARAFSVIFAHCAACHFL